MSDKPLSSLHQKIYNNPHLMTSELFNSVEQFLVKPETNEVSKPEANLSGCRWKNDIEDLQYNEDTGVGILPITGMLTYEESDYWWMDTTSYKSLLEDTKTMIEAGATTIVMDLDSGGGLAYSMTQTGSELRKMCDDSNVKLLAYNDGIAASACYGLGCVAHEFIVNPDAETGSIGVVVSLTNWSNYENKLGIKRTYITAGDGKVPYTKDGEFSKEFLEDIQTKVDALYERFTSHVSQYRDISQESVKALGAKVYSAADAVENGLADKQMTREEFFNYLADVSDQGKPKMALNSFFKPKATTPTKETEMSDNQVDVQAQLASLKEEMTASLDAYKADAAAKLATKDAELETFKQALAAYETEKKEAKAAERLATLSAALGDVEAGKLAPSLSALDDTAFAVVAASLVAKADSQEAEMTAEAGANGKEVVTEGVKLSKQELAQKEGERMKAKYTKQSK